jgi:hypothetical protein
MISRIACRLMLVASVPTVYMKISCYWLYKGDSSPWTPNVVVEWLTLLLRIREVPGSNFGPLTGYPGLYFSWFLSAPLGECRVSASKLGYGRFLPNYFHFITHHPFHSTLYSLSFWKVSLNKLQILTNTSRWTRWDIVGRVMKLLVP